MSEAIREQDHEAYYVPHDSVWPIVAVSAVAGIAVGLGAYLNGAGWGPYLTIIGIGLLIFMMFGWFGDMIKESLTGMNSQQMDRTYRWGMGWFIFSEIMFFAGFFGALYYMRNFSIFWLSGGDPATAELATQTFGAYAGGWPSNGPAELGGDMGIMDPWHLPLINTLLLLTSGITLTWAHHQLHARHEGKEPHQGKLVAGLAATVALGLIFLCFQVYEYIHAMDALNIKLGSGAYGSTFYMLTGFHGMHVTLGTIMLIVITLRAAKGHFQQGPLFGFESVAWYWHFVDVVWVMLFFFVYIL